MSIRKIYEIVCEDCGCGQHFFDTKAEAIREFREAGGHVTWAGKFHCGCTEEVRVRGAVAW